MLMTTEDLYSFNGVYTRERSNLHNMILEEMISFAKVKKEPSAILMGGGTASGKTAIRILAVDSEENNSDIIIIDPDMIKEYIPEYQKYADSSMPKEVEEAAAHVHDESTHIANRLLEHCVKHSYDFVYDGTMKNLQKYTNLIRFLKENRYKVKALYADIPVEEAIRREEVRFKNDNRKVPDSVILESHEKAPSTFLSLLAEFDSYVIYDNTGEYPEMIAMFDNGNLEVFSEEKLRTFEKKGGKSTVHFNF